jgi:hypothetical protein
MNDTVLKTPDPNIGGFVSTQRGPSIIIGVQIFA